MRFAGYEGPRLHAESLPHADRSDVSVTALKSWVLPQPPDPDLDETLLPLGPDSHHNFVFFFIGMFSFGLFPWGGGWGNSRLVGVTPVWLG